MAFSRSAKLRTRVAGSGFTAFFWNNDPIPFMRQIAHVAPTPVGPGPTPIQPLDEPYPIDIITPAAQTIGTLTLELYEVYNQKVWDNLSSITGEIDLVNVFIKLAADSTPVTIKKVIWPPTLAGQTRKPSTDMFLNCVVTNIEDGETVEIGTMEITKRISVAYERTYRIGYDGARKDPDQNRAFTGRNLPSNART
jgi:hypothetical protein